VRAPAAVKPATPPRGTQATPSAADGKGGDAFEARARAMLGQGDATTAREVLAAALVVYPRSKPLRSLYYVATALTALEAGEVMLAQSQLETALAHFDQCTEAAQLLDHIRRYGGGNVSDAHRIFQ
jgi:hypothetical protein